MREEKQEGIVLRSLDFKDREKIITLFTKERGLVSLIVKGITKKKSHLLTLTSPFTHGEYHYSIRRSDLYPFKDGTPITTHHTLRKSLAHIETATTIARSLLSSQLPGKAAPALYRLTLAYLKIVPEIEDPLALSTSFFLKLLLHDGHLTTMPTCSLHSHTDRFSAAEWLILSQLATARTIAALNIPSVHPELHLKTKQVFEEIMIQ